MFETKILVSIVLALCALNSCDAEDPEALGPACALTSGDQFAVEEASAGLDGEGFLRVGIPGTFDSYKVYKVCNPDALSGIPPTSSVSFRGRAQASTEEEIGYVEQACCAEESYFLRIDSLAVR